MEFKLPQNFDHKREVLSLVDNDVSQRTFWRGKDNINKNRNIILKASAENCNAK
jgi:hypothetical protein